MKKKKKCSKQAKRNEDNPQCISRATTDRHYLCVVSVFVCVQFVYLWCLCVILVTNTAVNLQTFTDLHQDAWPQEILKPILQCFGGFMDHPSFVSDQ